MRALGQEMKEESRHRPGPRAGAILLGETGYWATSDFQPRVREHVRKSILLCS